MRYVALLRGINVGGKNMIKMEPLRELFSTLGFQNVTSYINSGNLAFDTGQTDDNLLAKRIHDAIESQLGFDVSVMVRSRDEIAKIIDSNPYRGQFENYKDHHIFFLDRELSTDQEQLLLDKNSDLELITVNNRTIYYLLRI